MDIKQINTAIIHGTWTNDQLNSMAEAIRFVRANLGKTIKYTLKVGDNVSFTSTKNGRLYKGLVVKIAVKFVTVRTIEGLWKVPANMLSKIENEVA